MKIFIKLLVSLVVLLLFFSCGKKPGVLKTGPLPEKSVSGQVLSISFNDPIDTIDQQKAVYSSSFEIIGSMMDGLMQMTEDGSVKKAICEEESVSPDGLLYTFKLRKDVFWSNGEPVTAHDFVYGWQRAVEPATESEYAFMMADIAQIKNAGAIIAGKMDANQLGVRAVDDYTFEVQLEVPVSYFDQLLYFCTFYPANEKFIEKVGDKYGTSADTYLCNGAFFLTEYKPDSSVTLIKNTAYYDASSVKLGGLHYIYVRNGDEALRRYKFGEIDLVSIDGEQVKNEKENPALKAVDSCFLFYLSFNLKETKLQNKNLRQALALAFDREMMAEEISDGSVASFACVPRGFAFDSNGVDFTPEQPEFPDYCSFNPERARELLNKAKLETGKSDFEIEFLVADVAAQKIAAESFRRQVEENLKDVHIKLRIVPKADRRKIMARHEFEIGLTNWGPDYADPMTYLAMWVTGNENNYESYSNPQYNALIARCSDGDLCTIPPERWKAMKQAETMLMEDMAVTPFYQQCDANMINPAVKGIEFHAVAVNRIFKHAIK